MPWIHFHVGNRGTVQACCVANIPYGNINDQSFDEIWQGEAIDKLRQRFAAGEKDNRCAACFKLEEAGGKSIRQETHEKFAHIDISQQQPVYFDIRFSNTCNFSCRTCWHGASSGWFRDAKLLGRAIGKQAVLNNIEHFESFIDKIGNSLLQAEEIYFAGGEPLVTKAHYQLLDWLIENNVTDVRLRYNTNFSKLNLGNRDVLPLWEKFRSIEILASIDASEKLGEYIRKGMDWQQILKNRSLIAEHPHIQFKIAPTLSVFNIIHLPDLYRFAVNAKMITPTGFYLNVLHRPLHFNVQIIPAEYKQKIKEKYNKFISDNEAIIPASIKTQFKEIVNYMSAEDRSKLWTNFQKETNKLDKIRSQAYEEIILPQYQQLLKGN